MNQRLEKQWNLATQLLQEASAEILERSELDGYESYILHNELELALDELSTVGENLEVSSNYWHCLFKAAEVMGLREKYAKLRRKHLETRNAS